MKIKLVSIAILIGLMVGIHSARRKMPSKPRRQLRNGRHGLRPARDPNTPGYVTAKDLPDGELPPANVDGNFIIGPTHKPAPEMKVQDDVPHGTIKTLTMDSADSKIYPGIARDQGTFGTADPDDPAKLVVTTSHPAHYSRKVTVYVPKQYVPGTAAPFIVGADGARSAICSRRSITSSPNTRCRR